MVKTTTLFLFLYSVVNYLPLNQSSSTGSQDNSVGQVELVSIEYFSFKRTMLNSAFIIFPPFYGNHQNQLKNSAAERPYAIIENTTVALESFLTRLAQPSIL